MKNILYIVIIGLTGCSTTQEPWLQELNSLNSHWREPISIPQTVKPLAVVNLICLH